MKVAIIAACDQNRLIGVDGKIPWALPKDLRRFKETTMGKAIIMGRETFKSMGCKPLPGRLNVVIGSYPEGMLYGDGYYTCHALDYAVKSALESTVRKPVFLIGGQRIYEEGLQYADTIFLTNVHAEFFGKNDHRYFPKLDRESWAKVESEESVDGLCTYETYRRILP